MSSIPTGIRFVSEDGDKVSYEKGLYCYITRSTDIGMAYDDDIVFLSCDYWHTYHDDSLHLNKQTGVL